MRRQLLVFCIATGCMGSLTRAAVAIPTPTITSFTPVSGASGQVVTISGTGFTGATAVMFNIPGTNGSGTPAGTFSVVSDTSITATEGAGATTGPISVTTPGGTATSGASFTVLAPDDNNDFPGLTSSIELVSGTVNGQSITPTQPQVTVAAAQVIAGQVTIKVDNTGGGSDIFPVIWTPTWGDRTTSYQILDNWQSPGIQTHNINLNLQAPSIPGTYYIVAAARWEVTGEQVASCTGWQAGPGIWFDGNDIVDWPKDILEYAITSGRVLGVSWDCPYGLPAYQPENVPATAIRVVVTPQDAPVWLTSSLNPSSLGQSVCFTATIAPLAVMTGTPTGSVAFLDGATTIGTQALTNGVAAFSTSGLPVGSHAITASYSGDALFAAGTSTALAQTVLKSQVASVTLTSSQNPAAVAQTITFTATVLPVAPATGTPTGTVTFMDGTTAIGTAAVSNGTAAISASTLTVASHKITASYSGDASYGTATSTALVQVVTPQGLQLGSPWPMFHQNTMHTGIGVGSGAPNRLRWQFATGWLVTSSPAVGSDGTIYVGSEDNNLYAINSADGSQRWKFTTGAFVRSSPTVGADGTVYVGSDDCSVYAINPAIGSQKWKFTTGSFVYSSPAIGADGTIYVGSGDGNIYAINPSDGSQKWKFTTNNAVYSSPAVGADGTIYVGSDDHNLYALDPAHGTLKWKFATGFLADSSPAIGADGTIYVGSYDYNLYAINPADGTQKWKFPTGDYVASSPAIGADGTIYVGSDDFNLYAINPVNGRLKWKFATGYFVDSSPAIGADGTIYVGSGDSNLHAINPADGSSKWSFATSGAVYSSPAIATDGTVYVGSDDGCLYAIGNPAPPVALSSSSNPTGPGQQITFSATVSPVVLPSSPPTGTVTFLDGKTTLGTQTLTSGLAALSVSTLSVGIHTIVASYSGDANFAPAASVAVAQVVQTAQVASVTLTSSQNPALMGQEITFTATVWPAAAPGTPSGTLTFLDGATTLGTGTLSNGAVTYATSSLTSGLHHITASYSGDGKFGPATGFLNELVSSTPWPMLHQNVMHTCRGMGAGATGTLKWKFPTGNSVNSSPAIGADGTIYVGSNDNNLYAINPSDGGQKWKFTTGGAVYSSPAIGADGTIYVGSEDNNFYAINPADGSQKWKFTTGGEGSPAIGPDGTIYVADGSLYAINPADGSQKWKFTTGGGMFSSPAIEADGTIYVVSVGESDDDLYAINPADGSQKWMVNAGADTGDPTIGPDGTIYLGGEEGLIAFNPADGSGKWGFEVAGEISYSAPAIGADGTIYLGAIQNPNPEYPGGPHWPGGDYIYAIDPGHGSVKWTAAGRVGDSSPAIGADGTVYVGSGVGSLCAINATDGSEKWSLATGNLGHSSPAIGSDGTIYVGSGDGNLYAIGGPVMSVVVALSSSSNPTALGQTIKFTARVSPMGAAGTPTGTVSFLSGTMPLGTQTLTDGAAVFCISSLTGGIQAIKAYYSGDTSFAAATSAVLTQLVTGTESDTVGLTSSVNPSALGRSIAFTATVSPLAPASGTPTGTVTLLDGIAVLAVQALSNGLAAFSISNLTSGSHTITAAYSGDSTFEPSSSAFLAQIVRNGWIPADISIGADDLCRVLWANPDGQAVLWSLERTTGNYTQGPVFGPFDGGFWQATRIACGKDGISHVLWNQADGALSLWWLTADNSFQKNVFYGPFAGWVATDIAVGSDDLTRVLWTNVNDGRAVVWSVDANGNPSNNTNFYGPYPGYTAVALACGTDGLTRLVWANPLGIASLWIMNAQNQYQSFTIFGAYASWIPTDVDVGSDDLARLLWTNNVDGRAIVWSVDTKGNPTNSQNFYGPYTGYTAQHIACGSDSFNRVTWLKGDGTLSFWHMAPDNTMLTFNIYGPYY